MCRGGYGRQSSGPWSDHGPLVCDPDGSIDGFAITGEDGRRYLIYKEDGNSRKMPTPIWAQRLTEDGLKLTGERTELIRNTATWEGAVVEGPFILPHNGYFYLFYAGGACCGSGCNYAEGVARSKQLLGPYREGPVESDHPRGPHVEVPRARLARRRSVPAGRSSSTTRTA